MNVIKSRFKGYEWDLVQHKDVRSVYKLTKDDSPSLYIKIYHPTSLFQRLRNLIYPKTLKEARMLEKLKKSGIMVPDVVDHIRHGHVSALVTRAISPSKSLLDTPHTEQANITLDMAYSLLEKGFLYKDLHAGNLILEGSQRPVLVDAYEIVPKHRIRDHDIVRLLAQVASVYNTPHDILTNYVQKLSSRKKADKVATIIRKTALSNKRRMVKRLIMRLLRQSSFSEEISTDTYRAYIHKGNHIDLDDLISRHRQNILNNTNILKYQAKTQLSIVDNYCVKSYKRPRLLTRPYALRGWKGLLTLYFNNIPVPSPVAIVIFKDRSSVLITKALAQPNIDRVLYHEYAHMDFKQKIDIARALGKLIGHMHTINIYHADLKACNIKLSQPSIDFLFLDTDKVIQSRRLSKRRRLKNLVQLNTSIPTHVSLGVRMAFIKAYSAIIEDNPKDLFRKIWGLSSAQDVVYCTDSGDRVESWRSKSNSHHLEL
ncbi:MAG: lipopolysaccharide kinase InaA family protein [Thermodesulfobacteriota bacterium]|nr:lipopolysaccharide kinase InaA family protein [Thermodesulfobacteriota bacterium]